MRKIHPDFETLEAAAFGRGAGEVGAHLASCAECRATIGVLRQADEGSAESRPAPADVLERALARRSAGDRHVLPTRGSVIARWEVRMPRVAALVVAGATLGLLMNLSLFDPEPTRTGNTTRGDCMRALPSGFIGALAGFFASAACADGIVTPYAAAELRGGVPGLEAGVWTYEQRSIDDGFVSEPRRRDVTSVSRLSGDTAWHLVTEVEWLYTKGVSREGLTLSTIAGPSRVEFQYLRHGLARELTEITLSRDSIAGSFEDPRSAERARRVAFARPDAYPIVSMAHFRSVLAALPLEPGWRGSVWFVGNFIFGSTEGHWMNLEVVGADVVTVPAGTFEAWRLEYHARGDQDRAEMWVDKESGWLVRRRIEYQSSGFTDENVLVSWEPGD